MEEDTVLDPEGYSLNKNSDPEFFTVNTEAITIIKVVGPGVSTRWPTSGHAPKFGGNGRNPALIVTQNEKTYRFHFEESCLPKMMPLGKKPP